MSEQNTGAVEAARAFIQAEARAMLDVGVHLDESFERAARLILNMSGRLVVSGAGTSGFMARRAAHIFSVSGTPAFFVHSADAMHGSMAALKAGDVLIVLSKRGGSDELNHFAGAVQSAGAKIVALTCFADSDLARLADLPVVLPQVSEQADPGGVIAMGSTLAHAAWLDALAMVLMRVRRYPWEKVLFTHPGGGVGKLSDLPAPLPPLALGGAEPAE